ncbi:unnamed protein product [Brassica napus]|uniref:(rape) hypothetical protein n=1 Tax=Brassica napus TaxID=3708 RepID=A0A816P151_BRANA|nr:unnamed protein product [Brassica napus]
MATNCDNVIDLSPAKTTWKIKVKIIRLWRQYSAGDIDSIEMVLIDSNGDTIQATLNEVLVPIFEPFLEQDDSKILINFSLSPAYGTLSPEYLIGDYIMFDSVMKDLVTKFDPFLSQGSSKIFINFSVGHSYGSYRTTKHPYKISFLETTRVRSCESPIEVSGFDPAIYRDILDGSLNSDYLVDVIGQIVKVSPIEVVTVNGKDTNKISLELRNSNDERLQTVLWGVFPTDVMEAIQMRRNYAIIYERSISNAYNVSDVSLNPPMVEVDDFIAVLPKDQLVLAIVDPKPLKTISQLSDARNVEKCIVMCTIASIDSDMGWYYLSCKVCAKKVLNVPNDFDEDGNDDDPIMFTYYCPNCKVSNPNLLPRYKLHLIVLDSTGSSKFVLFDNLAIQLLHQPCTELVGANADEIQDPAAIPLALNNLIGKTYLFKVGIERENYLYKNDTYIISKVITNHDIITEFQTIVHPKKPSVTYSCDNSILMVSDESSQECEGTDLTPAKRRGTLIDNLEAAVDHNSLTRSPCNTGIKKEKTEEKRNKSEGPSLQEQDTLGEADMFSKPRDVISNTHVLRDIANFLGSVQKDGQAQTIDHLVDERNLVETAATKEVSKTVAQRNARTERFNILREKKQPLSITNQSSSMTKDDLCNVKMQKDARSHRLNMLCQKRKCQRGDSPTDHAKQSENQPVSSTDAATDIAISSVELYGREPNKRTYEQEFTSQKGHISGQPLEQKNVKFNSNGIPPAHPAVSLPGTESFTNLLQSMVTQNRVFTPDSYTRPFVHNSVGTSNYVSPQVHPTSYLPNQTTFTQLLQSVMTQSSVVGGLHTQKETTDVSPMNIRQMNGTGNSAISSIDSDSEESCDDIWGVDTTTGENDYHFNSETESEDDIQIVEEQQEEFINDAPASLGMIVSDTRNKRKRTKSASSTGRIEGTI